VAALEVKTELDLATLGNNWAIVCGTEKWSVENLFCGTKPKWETDVMDLN
jgi:hypothetical protein